MFTFFVNSFLSILIEIPKMFPVENFYGLVLSKTCFCQILVMLYQMESELAHWLAICLAFRGPQLQTLAGENFLYLSSSLLSSAEFKVDAKTTRSYSIDQHLSIIKCNCHTYDDNIGPKLKKHSCVVNNRSSSFF